MKIYIDFDDVVCETARFFTKLAYELFGVDVQYSQFQFFDMQRTFDLTYDQYVELMKVGHLPEKLLGYEKTVGAIETINKWAKAGHDVYIITGRPFEAYDPSRQWLDENGLEHIQLLCVNKYGREAGLDYSYNLSLDKFYSMDFDFIVEDSPASFEHVLHFEHSYVAILDRPWNKQSEFPSNRFVRCMDWQEIDKMFENISNK